MSIKAPRSTETSTRVGPSTRNGAGRKLQHALVPPAMLIAAIAIGVASNLHLGLSPEVSVAVGVCLFCLMLMSHLLLRVADEADRVAEEKAERRTEQVSSPMPMAPIARAELPAEVPAAAFEDAPNSTLPEAQAHIRTPENWVDPAFVSGAEVAAAAHPVMQPTAAPDWGHPPNDLGVTGLTQPAAADELPTNAGERELPELGNLRPAAEDALGQPAASTMSSNGSAAETPAQEADRIDAILKRLALQIHSGSAERRRAAPPGGETEATREPTLTMPPATDGAALEQLAAEQPDNALSSAVDALRSTVEAMRGPAVSPAEPPSPVELRIAAVAEAIQAERADVFLAPILGLADQQAHHFEVSVKLRADGDDVYDPRAVAAGAGLLPLLDALNVRHAAGFALMLERRARTGSVFSQVGGASLRDERFVNDLSGRHAQGIADRMVLTFVQDDVRGLGPAQIEALGDLGRLGFRFALEGVADLDMDFEALKAIGFDFVKLDAGVFQGGLICSGEHVPSSDICRHLEDLGLAVVVTGIGDAATRDLMVGCGVVLGQGALFGAPRAVPVASPAGGTMAA